MTDVATVQEYLGITGNDALITRLIAVAQKMIETYTKRTFAAGSFTEVYRGTGTSYLNLRHLPVTALTSFKYNNNTTGDPSWTAVESDAYFLKTDTGQIYKSIGFLLKENEYQVVYTAGEATPADIEQACIDIVAHLFNSRTSGGMKSESLGEASYTRMDTTGDLLDSLGLKIILDSYREPTI